MEVKELWGNYFSDDSDGNVLNGCVASETINGGEGSAQDLKMDKIEEATYAG